MGRSAASDEWLRRSSRRLALANSKSRGATGGGTVTVDPDNPPVDDSSDPEETCVVERPELWTSSHLLDAMRHFLSLGGLAALARELEQEDGLPPAHLAAALTLAGRLAPHLSRSTASALVDACRAHAERIVRGFSDERLRLLSPSVSASLLSSFRRVLRRTLSRPAATARTEELQISLARRLLQCPLLARRLHGWDMVSAMVAGVENAGKYPDGVRRTATSVAGRTETVTDLVPVAAWLTAETLWSALHREGLIAAAFVGSQSHAALIKRTVSFLRFAAHRVR